MVLGSFLCIIQSFKNKNILFVFAYDLCFLLIAGIIAKAASKIMSLQLQKAGITTAPTPEIISQQLGAIKTLAITIFIITIIFYFVTLLAYSLSRAYIWTKIMNTKPTREYIKKFFALNLVWITCWTLLFMLSVTVISSEYYKYMLLAGIILYIHLTTIMHHAYTYKQEIKRAIGKAFTTGIGKIGYFIIPYIYIIIVYIIATKAFVLIPAQAQYYAMFAVLLLFMAWYRTYMNSVITSTQKRGK